MRIGPWSLLALALWGMVGCGAPQPGTDAAAAVDAGRDASPDHDGGDRFDASIDAATVESDAGDRDAGARDAGDLDAGTLDGGATPTDAGAPDAFVGIDGSVDAGADAGLDGGTDAGVRDPGVWTPTAAPPPGLIGRTVHTAVWTGTEMIVFGGENTFASEPRLSTGALYRPSTDSWRMMSSVGARARARHSAIWTGTEMIVFGGRPSDTDSAGEAYDVATDSWSSVTSVGAPPPRYTGHSAVWTGTEMIVWGGSTLSGTRYDTGGRYDPVLDRWTAMSAVGAPSGRSVHVAVWTGTEMIVWGGGSTVTLGDGAAYDPATDSWRPLATTDAPSPRLGAHAVWTGSVMIVWGGGTGADLGGVERRDGALYDPALDTWTRFATPTSRSVKLNAAVWTGTEMMMWGGSIGSSPEVYLDEGAAFEPITSRLTLLPTLGAPRERTRPTAVWTGDEMIVWGGYQGTSVATTGGRYQP